MNSPIKTPWPQAVSVVALEQRRLCVQMNDGREIMLDLDPLVHRRDVYWRLRQFDIISHSSFHYFQKKGSLFYAVLYPSRLTTRYFIVFHLVRFSGLLLTVFYISAIRNCSLRYENWPDSRLQISICNIHWILQGK